MIRRNTPPLHTNVPVHRSPFPYRFADWAAI